MTAPGTARPPRDWVPAAIVLALALALGLLILFGKRGEDRIAERTGHSGLPLTAEQKSVRFDAADLTFDVQPSKKRIDAVAKLDFSVLRPIGKLHLDLDPRYEIASIEADGRKVDGWKNESGLLTIPVTKRGGERLVLAIAYGGQPHVAKRAPWDGGFQWKRTPDGKPWVASAVQGEGCDMFWPCFDNASVEIPTVTQHIIVPEGLSAPSNGRLLGVDQLNGGRTRWNWVAKSPTNYAISINVGPYQRLETLYRSRFGNSFPIQYWHLAGHDAQARALFAEMARTVDVFEALIGPYPFGDEKVGVVETPHLGMEHQTINAYGNKYRPEPYAFDWLFNHEFAHEWFGNQLTNADWDDMWLHEGFGSYMQPLSLEVMQGRMAYHARLWEQRQRILNRHPLVFGKSRTEHEVYDDDKGSGIDIYMKGSWVLHTLRGLIGDEAFLRSIRRMVYGRADPKPGNFGPRTGTTPEFERIVAAESGRDLGWLFNVYLREAKLPRLQSNVRGSTLELAWATPNNRPFPMPVEVAVNGARVVVPMTGNRGSVPLPRPNAVVTLDPDTKLLRQDDAMDRFRDWKKDNPSK